MRSLYGLCSARNAWREHLANTIRQELGYVSCQADPDIHMNIKRKPSGERYWSYIVCYADDILCIDHDPIVSMNHLGTIYRMKEDSIGSPSMYLGANIKEWAVQDEFGKCTTCYAMGSSSYVKESI